MSLPACRVEGASSGLSEGSGHASGVSKCQPRVRVLTFSVMSVNAALAMLTQGARETVRNRVQVAAGRCGFLATAPFAAVALILQRPQPQKV